jgi:hypothetical protein
MLRTFVVGMMLAVLAVAPLSADDDGPDYLISLDLSQWTDFALVKDLGVKPVFRWGNEFCVVLGADALAQLNEAGLDLVYLIDYVFRGGPAPVAGCVR